MSKWLNQRLANLQYSMLFESDSDVRHTRRALDELIDSLLEDAYRSALLEKSTVSQSFYELKDKVIK
jgi:hypothetical protein